MVGSAAALRSHSPSSSLVFDFAALDRARPRLSAARSTVACNDHRSSSSIPKLEPFSRSKIERLVKDPPFLQKRENDLTDYCTTLEGDESCSCWAAYFELKDLEKDSPKEDVEKLVRQAGGLKSLIDCVHGITAMQKRIADSDRKTMPSSTNARTERPFPVPDGLPKTQEELDEEEEARMPDSQFTRLLRSKGRSPAWYSQAPDHETD